MIDEPRPRQATDSGGEPPAGQTLPTPVDTRPGGGDLRRCPRCQQLHPWELHVASPCLCDRCRSRVMRRARWAELPEIDRVARLAACGVGGHFCRGGRPPSYDDAGLADRLAANTVPPGGLLICGPVGTHKTHLLCARVTDAVARGFTARLASWSLVVADCCKTYGVRGQSESEILDALVSVDYLALDDLGVGLERRAATDNELRLLYLVVEQRCAAGCTHKITDVATNLTPSEVATAFDDRIARRIVAEMTTIYVMD